MTMTTPRGPESTVLRMVINAMHIQNIEVETGWTPDEIKAVAMRNGYALDAASRRFRRAPQPKPAPVGIVRTQVTTPCPHRSWESLDGITHCMDCGHSVEVTVDDADDAEAARVLGTSQTSTGAEVALQVPVDEASQLRGTAVDRSAAPVLPETGTGAADTGLLASDPRGTNRERGGEPSPSAPVLPEVPTSTVAADELLAGVKRRRSGLTTLDLHTLDRAVDMFLPSEWAWDTYLVGTAQTGGEYRDVDVRTILEDDEFDAVFRTRKNLWGAWCFAIGTMLRTATGLPIDYQVQRRTEANEKHPGGGRNPVGRSRRDYAGGGDATQFTSCDVCLDRVGPSGPVVLCDRHAPTPVAPSDKRSGNYPTGPRITHGATQSQIRDWARTQGLDVNPRGTVRRDIADAYAAAHPQETP